MLLRSSLFEDIARTGLKRSFVARSARCEARRGKRAKKPEVYPLRYTEDFFAKFDEVAARISSTAAEDTFETSSNDLTNRPRGRRGVSRAELGPESATEFANIRSV